MKNGFSYCNNYVFFCFVKFVKYGGLMVDVDGIDVVIVFLVMFYLFFKLVVVVNMVVWWYDVDVIWINVDIWWFFVVIFVVVMVIIGFGVGGVGVKVCE